MDVQDELQALRRRIETLEAAQAELQLMKDRQAILDCIVRESRGRDRHDVDLINSCYWPDGAIDAGARVTPASEYAERQNAGHTAGFSATSHNLTNHACEIDGDTASCETYVIGALLARDESTCKYAAARYIDRLERRNGEWRIVLRRNIIDAVAEGDASWLKALTGFLKGQWSKADPAYRRPIELAADDLRWP
jgi:hypothetical protein